MLTARFRTGKFVENNPMHSRNGRIGPIYASVDLGSANGSPCQIRYII